MYFFARCLINIDYFMVDECVQFLFTHCLVKHHKRMSEPRASEFVIFHKTQQVNKIIYAKQP